MKGHLTQFVISGLSQRKRHLSRHQKDKWESAQWKIKEGQSVLDRGQWSKKLWVRKKLSITGALKATGKDQVTWGFVVAVVVQSCPTLYDPVNCSTQASLSFIVSWSLLKFMSIESVMPFNHLIHCCPLLLMPSTFPSIRVFCSESALHIRWPKWSFSFSIRPSNSGLISFRIDWFDLTVQGTLKSLLQHHNLKASVLQHSTFFMVQLSHPYMAVGKTDYMDLCWQSDVSAF